ncbi:MAG: hypothetical protein K2N74_00365, partial [Clostridiales bacterium]|nr:hypothetical protein [Clostridiales bacterium]
ISVIPNNAKPYDKGLHYGERRGGDRHDRRNRGERNERRGERHDRKPSSGGGTKRGKKEIYFGTFLGNSGNKGDE